VRLKFTCEYPYTPQNPGLRRLLPLAASERGLAVTAQPPYCKLADSEIPYFEHFQTVVAHELAAQPFCVSEFWHRTVPRDAFHNRFVLDAIVAISALSRAVKSRRISHVPDSTISFQGSDHYRHYSMALKHYAKALAEYRILVAKGSTAAAAPRKILIATLLITVFETMQGNSSGVDAFTAKGILVLKDTIMRKDDNGTASQVACKLDDDGIEDAEFYLARRVLVASLLSPQYPQSRQSVMHFRQLLNNDWSPPDLSHNLFNFNRSYMRFITSTLLWLNRVVELTVSGYRVDTDPLLCLEHKTLIFRFMTWLDAISERMSTRSVSSCGSDDDPKDWLHLNLLDISTKTAYISASNILDRSREIPANYRYTQEIIDQCQRILSVKISSPQLQKHIHKRLCFTMVHLARECRDAQLLSELLELTREISGSAIIADTRAAILGYAALAAYQDVNGVLPEKMNRHDWVSASWDESHTMLYLTITARRPAEHTQRQKRIALRVRDYGLEFQLQTTSYLQNLSLAELQPTRARLFIYLLW
jgi:hypothetical protein